MTDKEFFEVLQIAEGYVRSAVWREESVPPLDPRPREALADTNGDRNNG